VRDSRRNRRRHHSEQEGAGRQMELHRIDFESNGIGQGRRQRCIVDLRLWDSVSQYIYPPSGDSLCAGTPTDLLLLTYRGEL
jgi:hypothetical protein